MGWVAVEERPAVRESTKISSILELREIEERQLHTVGKSWMKMELCRSLVVRWLPPCSMLRCGWSHTPANTYASMY